MKEVEYRRRWELEYIEKRRREANKLCGTNAEESTMVETKIAETKKGRGGLEAVKAYDLPR